MRIIYIARPYNSYSNDDEGAVEHALKELGHSVTRWDEGAPLPPFTRDTVDLVLFNKWQDPVELERLGRAGVVRAFWYWDLVNFIPDPALIKRSQLRQGWMADIIPRVDIGFCTDGDWAMRNPNKLVWLPQGVDERLCESAPSRSGDRIEVLYTGSGGPLRSEREKFVKELMERFGTRLIHIPEGVYRESLRVAYRTAKVVVAPDTPITNHYWSNRVYNVLGLGGFLIHPYCTGLAESFDDRVHLWYYHTRQELFDLIEAAVPLETSRVEVAACGLREVLASHTYRHRCKELVRTIQERFP